MIFHNITTIIHFAIRTKNANKIIFFIEDLSHFRFVEKIFQYFAKNNYEITVLSFENPFGSRVYNNEKINLIILKNDLEKIKILKNLKGGVFITTTPSIGSAIFPKSQIRPREDRPKYLYFFHSLVSPNEMYIKNSFKGFDYIFSPSNIISEQLKPLVGSKAKIFTTGYLLFDEIKPRDESTTFDSKVLIAPTWGEDGVNEIVSNLDKLADFINKQSLIPVFRPHPMTDISKLKIVSDVILDLEKDLINLEDYKYLITDFSGIALEFFYLAKRPVIFLDVSKKIKRKLNKKEKEFNLIENDMRTIIGDVFTLNEITKLESFPDINFETAEKFIQNINSNLNSLNKTIEILKAEGLTL